MTFNRWLIIRAGGECRITSRYPHLRYDEVAFRLHVTVPPMWGMISGDINLTVPEGAISVDVPEMVTAEPEDQPVTSGLGGPV